MVYHEILKKYWGYSDFRSLQLDIIQSIGNGKDTLGLMPTGGGKSITFQVPALAKEGLCLVVTPLIALMKDQVETLKKQNIKASAIFSGMSYEEIMITIDNCMYGNYKFLYVSPERLSTNIFLQKLPNLHISMIAVDESHCISQWGYDFRPSYLQIANIREFLPGVPILALTATATPEVVTDIQKQLKFPTKNVFQKSFERSNLAYVVRETDDKLDQLLKILRSIKGTAVVYVRNRKKTKEISDFLNGNGISADYFHAGLSNQTKDIRQKRWKTDECRVIVATNAFGMGIDKADVRSVIHMDLPDSIESYFQEAGRAGRDEKKAYAILLYSNNDSTKIKKRIADNFPAKEQIVKVYDALCNYLQIPVESCEGAVFNFNIADFCTKFHLPILTTYSALKMLQQAGYIEYTEEIDSSSRVIFTIHRDALYKMPDKNQKIETLIKTLLRSYTGLFTDFAYINEELIAQRAGLAKDEVYQLLIYLSKQGVIQYVPRKKTPFIVFVQQRQHSERIILTKEVYEERKARFEERAESILNYATNKDICRSRILLNYFGEKNTTDCGQCDVCLASKRAKVSTEYFSEMTEKIRERLQEEPLTISELTDALSKDEEKTIKIIRLLIEQGELIADKDLKLHIKQVVT